MLWRSWAFRLLRLVDPLMMPTRNEQIFFFVNNISKYKIILGKLDEHSYNFIRREVVARKHLRFDGFWRKRQATQVVGKIPHADEQ